MKINKKSRDIFLYMLIGDGYIDPKGIMRIKHCLAQKEYLEFKKNLLNSVGIKTSEIKEFDNNGYPGVYFNVRVYNFTKLYRKVIYTPKKNMARRKILNKFTPLGLAIWYMDDGGLSQKKRNGKIHANDLILNTHLSKEENQVIIDYFKEVWNINFTQVKNKGKYRLRCGTREARKFIKIVEPYIKDIKCMSHKLDIKK